MAYSTVQRQLLKDITPDVTNALIIGIIISRQSPHKFAQAQNNNDERAVLNFTLRDSAYDYINVTCWGKGNEIFSFHDNFCTGDVVDVISPRITIRRGNDYGEQYRPMVTSPYTLTINDITKQIMRHGGDYAPYLKLLQIPTKPLSAHETLADIHKRSAQTQAFFVNLLCAVRNVGAPRDVVIKDGTRKQVLDIIILDHTNPGMRISLWDKDIIARAASWQPRKTILFLTDVKIEWSQFSKTMQGSLSRKSIVTIDPIGREADRLKEYASTAIIQSSAIMDQMTNTFPDPYTIQNVMSIRQVLEKIDEITESRRGTEDRQFTALVYAVVTSLDLDGLSRVISIKCGYCKNFIRQNDVDCTNIETCPAAMGLNPSLLEKAFDLRLMLSDHTGSLSNCKMSGKVAEAILKCTVERFLEMKDNDKTQLKWTYLMERCAIRIMVLRLPNTSPLISILSCDLASPLEVAERLPLY